RVHQSLQSGFYPLWAIGGRDGWDETPATSPRSRVGLRTRLRAARLASAAEAGDSGGPGVRPSREVGPAIRAPPRREPGSQITQTPQITGRGHFVGKISREFPKLGCDPVEADAILS